MFFSLLNLQYNFLDKRIAYINLITQTQYGGVLTFELWNLHPTFLDRELWHKTTAHSLVNTRLK